MSGRALGLVVAVALLLPACARDRLRVDLIDGSGQVEEGEIVYALPRTRLTLEMEIEWKRRCRGELAYLADKENLGARPGVAKLGLVAEPEYSFAVRSARLRADSEADPEAHYRIQQPRRVSEGGGREPLALDVTNLGLLAADPTALPPRDDARDAFASELVTRGVRRCEVAEQRGDDAARKEADDAVSRLDDLLDRQLLLIAGHGGATSGVQSETFERMLALLDEQLALRGEPFVRSRREVETVEVLITDEMLQRGLELGAGRDPRANTIIRLDSEGAHCAERAACPGSRTFALVVRDQGLHPLARACERDCSGLIYRRPRQLGLTVLMITDAPERRRILVNETVPIPQLGEPVRLPPHLTEGRVAFHPETGGLRSIRSGEPPSPTEERPQ